MKKYLLTSILVLYCFSPISAQTDSYNNILMESKKYLESIEWDSRAYLKINKFNNYGQTYLASLSSSNPEDVYISAIMLGLLRSSNALPQLKKVTSNSILSKIGVSFAFCSLNHNYEENYIYLMNTGRTEQFAGRAHSLKYLNVVMLLSFLEDKRFPEYADSLITDETFQKEAIHIASQRYQLIYGK